MIIRIIAIVVCMFFLQADAEPEATLFPAPTGPAFQPGHYPIYSSHFLGKPSPFHETVATLVAKGAKLQPPIVARRLWAQGVGRTNFRSYRLPIFIGTSDQKTHIFSCLAYGGCKASGVLVHLPPGASPSEDSDHHLVAFDVALGGELDGWGGDGQSDHQCNLNDNRLTCSWGGFFPFSGNGLDGNSGQTGNNAGYAFGLFLVTAQEILQGHIDHALGMAASCLDNPNVYPSDTSKWTDTTCSHGTDNGYPQYGQLIRLKSSYDVAGSAYSPPCKTYLRAFQMYGAYTEDTNNGWGIALGTEDPSQYASPNPWYTKIFQEMVSYGDGMGTGINFSFRTCLNRLNASDIEVYDVAPGT